MKVVKQLMKVVNVYGCRIVLIIFRILNLLIKYYYKNLNFNHRKDSKGHLRFKKGLQKMYQHKRNQLHQHI